MIKNKENLQIVVIAGGKGKRMGGDEPKALAKLDGKPFLRYILDTIKELHLPIKPVVVVGYQKAKVIQAIGDDCIYAVQEEQLGTGHAVLSSKPEVNPSCKTIFILSVDQPLVSKETIEKIINTHEEKEATVTLGTIVFPDFKDWRSGMQKLGRIIRNKDNSVERIIENKDATEDERKITEINPALYVFNSNWLWSNINRLENDNTQQEYYLTDLIKIAFSDGERVEAVPVTNILEGLQPNTKEELQTLEEVIKK